MTYGYAGYLEGKGNPQLLKQQTEYASGNDTLTTAEDYELKEGGFVRQARGRSIRTIITEGKKLEAAQMVGRCPKCHKPCIGIYRRWVVNTQRKKKKRYWYWYAAHSANGAKVKWCYIGKLKTRL